MTLIGIVRLRSAEGPTIEWVRERLKKTGLDNVMIIQDAPSKVGRAMDLPEVMFPEDNTPKEVGYPEAMNSLTLHRGCDFMLRSYHNVA